MNHDTTPEWEKKMVDRFLAWKLPKDFQPDCGISYQKIESPNFEPVGTNLFTATQAGEMVHYMTKDVFSELLTRTREEAEQRGRDEAAQYILEHGEIFTGGMYLSGKMFQCNADFLIEARSPRRDVPANEN